MPFFTGNLHWHFTLTRTKRQEPPRHSRPLAMPMQFFPTKESEGSTISMAVMKSSRQRDRLDVVTIVADSMNMKILVMGSRYVDQSLKVNKV